MKTAKFSRSENQTITFRVALADVIDRYLTQEERDSVAGWSVTAWSTDEGSDDSEDAKGDKLLDITFTKSHDFKVDAEGQLVEQPREPRYVCAKKSDVAKLEAKMEEVLANAKLAEVSVSDSR